MSKIYSIIILMCSFCIAGFAKQAAPVGIQLPQGAAPDASGVQHVVIMSTNLAGKDKVSKAGIVMMPVVTSLCVSRYTGTIRWISMHNESVQTENNSGISPDAGYLQHTLYDEHNTPEMVVATGSDNYRFFVFNGVSVISSKFSLLSSPISSPLKTKSYG